MKPGNSAHEVVVLDRMAELKVIHDAVDNYEFRNTAFVSEDERSQFNEFSRHFTGQTRSEEIAYGGDKPGIIPYETWKMNPTFAVVDGDVRFVALAARRVLQEPKLIERTFNRMTGRTKAAKRILKVLAVHEAD